MTTKNEQYREEISKVFVPENATDKQYEHFSPDGAYKLVIRGYSTKPGCWDYSQGLIYRVGESSPLFEVQRNYHQFPFSWVDHPNQHQYLVTGQDYQGSTVLELDTGKRKDSLPEEAKQGWGFCWVKHRLDQETKILTVLGCCWACPYEFRFYDFSDPMNGWPVLECDECCYEDGRWPTFEADGTIQTYSTETEDDDDEEDGVVAQPGEWRATKVFRREGSNLILVREEVSEEEKVHREQQAEYQRLYDEKSASGRCSRPSRRSSSRPAATTNSSSTPCPRKKSSSELEETVRAAGRLTFAGVFQGQVTRLRLIGTFIALLELVKQQALRVEQEAAFGEIWLTFVPPEERVQAAAPLPIRTGARNRRARAAPAEPEEPPDDEWPEELPASSCPTSHPLTNRPLPLRRRPPMSRMRLRWTRKTRTSTMMRTRTRTKMRTRTNSHLQLGGTESAEKRGGLFSKTLKL